jgi:circadian clock protein KaiC
VVTPRLTSGITRLDDVLGGGIPPDAITLIAGAPGTGKTILAHHFVFRNATPERPVLYCSTVSEPLDKLLRYGETLEFFDPAVVGTAVLFEDLGGIASGADGLDAVISRLDTLLHKHRPAVIVIDSFKALRFFATDSAHYRRFLHSLTGKVSALAMSTLLLGEYTQAEDPGSAPEFALADTIISLSAEHQGYRTTRYLEVCKMRGGAYLPGGHAYRISEAGLEVFPRIADSLDASPYDQGDGRVSTGIDALDMLLGDGYWPGASTLVAGPTGSGKTLLGLHFLYRGAEQGEVGVLATLQESRAQLARIVGSHGWSLDTPGIHIHSRSPVGLLIDEWLHGVLDLAQRTRARRLVVDSLGDLLLAAGDEQRFREYLYSLTQRCARLQISILMTHELNYLFDQPTLSEFGISHLSDNVVLLQYLSAGDQLRRGITVLKTRASRHQLVRREYAITADGFVLADTP